MLRLRTLGCWVTTAFGLLFTTVANAATLQPVTGWGTAGLPSDVTMSIYVPDNVASNPPILTLIHYCGGTASAVFGQAQGGGIVRAADQYGFIIVAPSSGRCWDVVSNKTRMRDGGGDSHAIRQMVRYALQTHNGNPERVYATGDSSGGMMTELLLALYPDVFKAGAAFAGMPAGCRAANESGSGGGYSNACAGGNVTHTPQEWGDIARMLDPGYSGHRARVQLFHGDADTTIRYANHTEAIKQWTNVLGLSATPTSTSTVTLGSHQASRQRWQNSCGYVVLEAFTSMGGDHGPSDALFNSTYVIPLLGLDRTGAVDPEISQCGAGGAGGAGGVGGAAGASGVGGRAGGGAGGAGNGGNGGAQNGGAGGGAGSSNAGAGGAGGATTPGGGAGGVDGGASGASPGGSGGTSGAAPNGGAQSNGGGSSGGMTGASGSPATGGSVAGGSGGDANLGGTSGSTPSGASSPTDDPEPSGCGCLVVGTSSTRSGYLAAALGLALLAMRRKR